MFPVYSMGVIAASASKVVKDPYFANVVFLLNGDTIADSSSYAHAITNHSSVAVSTADSDFPHGAIVAANSSLEVTSFGTEFDFGAGDFTFEFDYKRQMSGGIDPIVVGTYSTFGANGGVGFFDHPSFASGSISMAADGSVGFSDNSVTLGALTQMAYSRVGSTMYVFVNGTLVQSITYTTHLKVPASLRIGQNLTNGNSNDFKGLIGKVRITKGVGRYTASYTPKRDLFPTS